MVENEQLFWTNPNGIPEICPANDGIWTNEDGIPENLSSKLKNMRNLLRDKSQKVESLTNHQS
ncbi:hypothetical protein [Evansella clarkii]|uniref:hypothetical protein n=1 Tax=Evansella clarkii TaxID=79879 RepID=UPI000B448EBB|nr:hypothetical protein [Evansella clarkii]